MIRTVIRAYRRGYKLGQQRARRDHLEFLRAQADVHQGEVGDARRRGALRHAADRLEQGRGVGRP